MAGAGSGSTTSTATSTAASTATTTKTTRTRVGVAAGAAFAACTLGAVGTVGAAAYDGAAPDARGSTGLAAPVAGRDAEARMSPGPRTDGSARAEPPAQQTAPGDVPGRGALELALLTPEDVGDPFVRTPPDPAEAQRTPAPTGCPALDEAIGSDRSTDPPEVELRADDVIVTQALYAATPEEITQAHARVRDALATCHEITLTTSAGDTFTLTVTPIDIGRENAVALQLDGLYEEIPVAGYLVFEPFGSVEMVYSYTQAGLPSPVLAEHVYMTAIEKMNRILGPAVLTPATPL